MVNEQNLVLQWLTLIVAVVLIIGSFTWFAAPVLKVPTAQEIADKITIPESSEFNLTSVEESIADIQSTLDEDEDFKDSCKDFAREYIERERKSFLRDLAERVGLERDDYKDINKIKTRDLEIADTGDYDVDEGDCTVNAELRVYFDSYKEDDVRQTVNVDFIIEENEIDDVIILKD